MDAPTLSNYGTFSEPATLTIQRMLPGSIERVWAYLTEGELRRQWLASGDMELKVGAAFVLVWHNDELTDPPGRRPEGFAAEHRAECRITELDIPRKLSFSWPGVGLVTFELDTRGDDVLLTVTHRRLPDRDTSQMVGAGWHMHLDLLVALFTGTKPPPFWDGWASLKQDYERIAPQ